VYILHVIPLIKIKHVACCSPLILDRFVKSYYIYLLPKCLKMSNARLASPIWYTVDSAFIVNIDVYYLVYTWYEENVDISYSTVKQCCSSRDVSWRDSAAAAAAL